MDLLAVLSPRVERACQIVASTDSINEAIGVLMLEMMEDPDVAAVAAIALIHLAAREDCAEVTQP